MFKSLPPPLPPDVGLKAAKASLMPTGPPQGTYIEIDTAYTPKGDPELDLMSSSSRSQKVEAFLSPDLEACNHRKPAMFHRWLHASSISSSGTSTTSTEPKPLMTIGLVGILHQLCEQTCRLHRRYVSRNIYPCHFEIHLQSTKLFSHIRNMEQW